MTDDLGPFEDVPLSDFELGPDDSLFALGPDWQRHALQLSTTTWGMPYAMSFQTAGNALVARALERRQQDFVAFPVLYCYRHAIELALKDIIYLGQRERGGPPEVIHTHRLDELWKRASVVVESAFEDTDPVHEHVARLVAELATVDPESEIFRYDRDRQGRSREVPEAFMRVDLSHIRTMVGKVIAYLDASHTAISAMIDAMPDY
ncbi:hypothetical protein [Baekduia sp. Peel2402]|uniref:hypothetical protein n=1 Tax=Baekduia sp. Peel2402 TaxID=3458296 RepID=UPI00403EA493